VGARGVWVYTGTYQREGLLCQNRQLAPTGLGEEPRGGRGEGVKGSREVPVELDLLPAALGDRVGTRASGRAGGIGGNGYLFFSWERRAWRGSKARDG